MPLLFCKTNTNCTMGVGGRDAGLPSAAVQASKQASSKVIHRAELAFPPSPNNVFALELDSFDPLTYFGSFVYSSIQMYEQNEDPNINGYGGEDIPIISMDKMSTYPVP